MDKNYLIIGTCGTGKTWIMKQLIEKFALSEARQEGLYHWRHNDTAFNAKLLNSRIAVLGKYDGTVFEGSDRFAMNIMAKNAEVKPILDQYDAVIAEGDRFTNQTYINTFKPVILRIKGDGAEGRAKRGSEQSERHIKSMTTRVNNIIPNFEFNNSEECLNFVVNELIGGKRTAEPYTSNTLTLF